jgi:ribosomal protein L37E
MRLFRAKPVVEFKRNCSECGYAWYVTAKEREMGAPGAHQFPGLMHSVGTRIQLGHGNRRPVVARQHLASLEARRSRFEAQRSMVEQINSCRECGSVTFTERRV